MVPGAAGDTEEAGTRDPSLEKLQAGEVTGLDPGCISKELGPASEASLCVTPFLGIQGFRRKGVGSLTGFLDELQLGGV